MNVSKNFNKVRHNMRKGHEVTYNRHNDAMHLFFSKYFSIYVLSSWSS